MGDPDNNNADGFDGSGLPGRVLTGNNIHRMEIQSLVFRDSSATGNGGAIAITGESGVGLRTSQFFNNSATGKGGAVFISQDAQAGPGPTLAGVGISENTFGSLTNAAEGNTADGSGGAVAIESDGQGQNHNSSINGSLFYNNVAGGNGGAYDYALAPAGVENMSISNNIARFNKARGVGGGAGHVVVQDATILRFDQELYSGNTVEPVTGAPATPSDHFGGGLYVEDNGSQIIQRGNNFTGNSVKAFPGGQDYGGGGEAIVGDDINRALSQNDSFIGNTVAGQPGGSGFESEGGGLYFAGTGSTFHGWLDVIAANQVGPGGEGGGAYAGAVASPAALEFSDSTIAGNGVGAGGSRAGLAGGGDDRLQLHNSIVFNGALDIGGFSNTADIQYSDACQSPGTAFPGAGNMCTNPLLRNPAAGDIHQTPASPTIDKGNDALFFSEEEDPISDFEGDPRPTDGDGDGHTVDIGADESPAFVPPVVGPTPKPQCADGKDNDADGAVDLKDPGCASKADTQEGDESVGDLILCGRRKISLVRADAKGKRVRLTGLVATNLAGRSVTIHANYGKRKLATVRANAAGQFTALVKGPPRKFFKKARFHARVAGTRSIKLKLPQSLASTSVKQKGDQITLRGRVKRSVLGKRKRVVVRRIVCGTYQRVGSARPNKRGRYVVRFKAPALGRAALYRAEAKVLVRPGSKRYVKAYARAIGISLTGQTG